MSRGEYRALHTNEEVISRAADEAEKEPIFSSQRGMFLLIPCEEKS